MPCPDVVVVGASAGGLEAVMQLIRSLPPDFPAAVFIVIHRGAEGPAFLPQLLARDSRLPILIPASIEQIRPGRIYLPPLDCHLLIQDGLVRATRGPRQHGFRPAVDPLFISAARSHGNCVAGVVLSGGLEDGTAGLLAIKRSGGTAIVQNPEEAPVPSMPLSALKNVEVDAVLSASDIGPRLVALTKTRVDRDASAAGQGAATQRKGTMAKQTTPEPSGERQLTPFTCPNCGGALWDVEDGGLDQYECHVGHRFSAEALKALGNERTENLLWSAVRALKEDAALRRRMAARVNGRGWESMARRWQDDARTSDERAQKIRDLIEAMNGTAPGEEVPLEAQERKTRRGARKTTREPRERAATGRKKGKKR